MNPYYQLVSEYARFKTEGKSYPLGDFPMLTRVSIPTKAPKALIFAPHPDDECIIGGLALRLLRQSRWHIVDVAVTQGSNKDRQAARWEELQNACNYIGFDLTRTIPNGLERINPKTRAADTTHWQQCVQVVANLLTQHQPRIIFFPHEHDWNSTHIGTHLLVMDALKTLPATFQCYVVETEYWGQMTSPNLMVESSIEDVSDLVTATSYHVGEVTRNPFHLLLPAWMQDNVRRGSELVGGQGQTAPDFAFATLYRLRKWAGGKLEEAQSGGRYLPAGADPLKLFP
ncbi:MAG: PIG-L family deacetylase [Verrucomicrobiota bacterium]